MYHAFFILPVRAPKSAHVPLRFPRTRRASSLEDFLEQVR